VLLVQLFHAVFVCHEIVVGWFEKSGFPTVDFFFK